MRYILAVMAGLLCTDVAGAEDLERSALAATLRASAIRIGLEQATGTGVSLQDFILSRLPVFDEAVIAEDRKDCRDGIGTRGWTVQADRIGPYARHHIPPVGPYCLAVLKEAHRRGRLLTPYEAQGDLGAALNPVLASAGQGATTYRDATGAQQALPCGAAFDAGYVFGWANAAAPLPSLDGRDPERVAGTCFANEASVKDGVIAGAHAARQTP